MRNAKIQIHKSSQNLLFDTYQIQANIILFLSYKMVDLLLKYLQFIKPFHEFSKKETYSTFHFMIRPK